MATSLNVSLLIASVGWMAIMVAVTEARVGGRLGTLIKSATQRSENEINKLESTKLVELIPARFLEDVQPLKLYEGRLFKGVKNDSLCKCVNYNCGCCLHLDLPSIYINDTGCANVTYLPKDYGVSITFDIDGYVFINETISARNPPPICAAVPHLHKYASICIAFHDLDLTKKHFYGCVRLQVRLAEVIKEEVELGCFNIPL